MAFDLINENSIPQAIMPGIKESESSQEVLQGQSVPAASELTQRVWVDAVQRDNKRQKKASGALETEPASCLDTDAVLDKEVRKDSFVIHTDSLSVFQMMTLEQRGALFTAVAAFHRGSNEELEEMLRDPVVGVAFLSMKERFIRDAKEYAKRCEANRKNARAGGLKRAENMKSEKGGKKGGKPKVASAADGKRPLPDIDIDTDVDTDDGIDTVSTHVDDKERHTGVCPKKDGLSLPPSPPEESEFGKFNAWLRKNCPNVLKLQSQMTEAQYHKLREKGYTKTEICEALEDLNNWKDFPKKRTNVYRSTLDELRKKYGEKK